MISSICKLCHKEFMSHRYDHRVYCSRECSDKVPKRTSEEISKSLKAYYKTAKGEKRRKECSSAPHFREMQIKARETMAGTRRTGDERYTRRKIPFYIKSPDGRTFYGENLSKFVRDNLELFDPEDTKPRKYKNRIASDCVQPFSCRAYNGLFSLHRRTCTRLSWKGWTRVK